MYPIFAILIFRGIIFPGCINNRDSFLRNPQYCFDVGSEGEEIVVQLSQPDVREKRRQGVENLPIGLDILKVEDNREHRIHTILPSVSSSKYRPARSVILRHEFSGPAGRYVLLPTTFNAGLTGEFLIRFFATCKDANLRQLKTDAPKESIWPCFSYPVCVTNIIVRRVTGLENHSLGGKLVRVRLYTETEISAKKRKEKKTFRWPILRYSR